MRLIHIHKAPSYLSQFSWTASVRQQFLLRAATDETQIWSVLFLTRCTSRLEHSTTITATTRLNGSCKLFFLNEPFLNLPPSVYILFDSLNFDFYFIVLLL